MRSLLLRIFLSFWLIIGLLAGPFEYGTSKLLIKLKVDDPIDAFAVHGACGAWGVLAAALFDWGEGFDFHHGWSGFGIRTRIVVNFSTADDLHAIHVLHHLGDVLLRQVSDDLVSLYFVH